MPSEEGCIVRLVVTVVLIALIASTISSAIDTATNILNEIISFFEGIWAWFVQVYQQIVGFFENLELPDIGDLPLPDEDEPPNPTVCEFNQESPNTGSLIVGEQAVVQNTIGSGLACRICPGKQDYPPEVWLENGKVVTVKDGPVSVAQDSWLWWQVALSNQETCWAAEGNDRVRWLSLLVTPTSMPTQTIPIPLPVPPPSTPTPTPTYRARDCFEGDSFGFIEDENREGHHYVEFHVDVSVDEYDEWFVDEAPFVGGDFWGWVPNVDGVGRAGFPWPDGIPVVGISPNQFVLCGIIR